MITVVTGTDIEKLKGEFESVINGMNMTGKISYGIYSELFDSGVDCIQKAYELGKAELEKKNSELKEELKKWKDEWQEQAQKATDEGFARSLQTNQLSKAKEIIKTFLGFAEAFGYSPSMDKFIAEAEQFLKDSEVK